MNSRFRLAEVQQVEVSIIKDIDALCKKHGLRYFLYCGTLLGCVRHEGFIPWDDDADLAMPLSDYKRFRKIALEEMSDRYIISDIHTDKYAQVPWLKVCRRGTAYYDGDIEDGPYNKEIWVDIYPMLGAYEGLAGKLQTEAIFFQRTLTGGDLRKAEKYKHAVHHVRIWRFVDLLPKPLLRFMNHIIEGLFWADPEKHRMCSTVDAARFIGKYIYRDWDDQIEGNFEGCRFSIPKEYDRFLRTMYGDYMKLPPAEKQVNHFVENAVIQINDDVAEEIGIKP